ncbi:agmatinase [candidate division TA06 bacterium]|uniref:Agmatinase n=1 Tax=candidate division TA06 bacterium TaxID=2250710 RepID=A0A660SI70_UNCT6|nr:MAG: agmatinase [candidate division TA06 bacterium]
MKFMDSRENSNTKIKLLGIPFDSTSSFRAGSRFAPDEIRKFSYNLESYSPILKRNLYDVDFSDTGNLDLPFGNTNKSINIITDFTKYILDDKSIPVAIGGEHLITFGIFKTIYERYPDVKIIQFDAHADLRDDYIGEKLSHATVMRRCSDLCGLNNIIQIGVRSGTEEEWEIMNDTVLIKSKNDFENYLRNILSPIYITIDLDILDPSIFPGTGTPEAGGFSYNELMDYIYLLENRNIVGLDIVEFSPPYDHSGISASTASKIIREILLIL